MTLRTTVEPSTRPSNIQPVVIQPACPGHTPFLARAIESADRGHLKRGPYEITIPDEGKRRDVLVFLAASSVEHWFVAVEGERLVGAAMAWEPTPLFYPLYVTPFQAFGWTTAEIDRYAERVSPMWEVAPSAPNHWNVECLAVEESHRGRGVAARLIEACLEKGRAAGFARVSVGHLIGNETAHRCYIRAGFEVVEESRGDAFEAAFGSPGYVELERDLGPPKENGHAEV